MKKIYTISMILVLFTAINFAQEIKDKVKFSGLMFGDYFYNIDNIDGAKKDLNGFQFRRIYFTADFNISEQFDTRFRTETDGSANSNTGGGKFGVMIKDAYLKWKGIFSGSDLIFGVSITPGVDASENNWGYRALEKVSMEFFGLTSSRDLGVDLKGRLNESGTINYWLKIANNSGNAPESDKNKRFYAMLQFKPVNGLQISLLGDYASKADKKDPFDNQNKSNNQLIGALYLNYKQSSDLSLGIDSYYRSIQNNFVKSPAQAIENQAGYGISFWGWVKLSDKIKFVARYDHLDPNTDLENDAQNFIVAGLDFKLANNVSLIPNFELMNYQGKDAKGNSKSDLVARITFAYTF